MTQTATPVDIAHRDGVCWISLSRPEKANALTVDMQRAMVRALEAAAAAPDIQAVVLTGAGDRVFCSGVDTAEVRSERPDVAARLRSHQMFATCLAMIDCPKPVVAALNGHAVGAGCILALLADARIATPKASLSLPEIVLGAPTFAGIAVVGRALGDLAASDLVQSGRRMGSEEAASRYVVAEICPPDSLAERAAQLALSLARRSPLAFSLNKAWIHKQTRLLLEQARDGADEVRAAVAASRTGALDLKG